jgi:MFS family permease
MKQEPNLTLSEARNIALNLNDACFMFSLMVGSLAFGALAMLLMDVPWQRFIAFVIGGILGVVYGVPLSAYYYLRRIDQEYFVGMSNAVVEWFRTAKDGDSLDMDALAAKVRAARALVKNLD